MAQYRIKDFAPPHFIGGRIVGPGEVVTLPEGVKAGQWLEPLEEPAVEAAPKGAKQKGRAAAPSVTMDATPAEPVDGEF